MKNLELAYQARAKMPWGNTIPEELFLNDVLPYASVTETREPWRQEMMDLCVPLVKDCKTAGEAAQVLNREGFKSVKVAYHATKRQKPDQSPFESMEIDTAPGLSGSSP